jgi:hypothetical protein
MSTTVTFGDRVGTDYPGTQDNQLYGTFADYNYGVTAGVITCGHGAGSAYYRITMCFDLSTFHTDVPYCDIDAVRLKLVLTSKLGANRDLVAYSLLQAWGGPNAAGNWNVHEGTKNNATAGTNEPDWNHIAHSDVSWNTAGAGANSVGIDGDESGDYNGANDRGNASLGSITVVGTGEITLTFNSLGRDVIKFQKENPGKRYGFILIYGPETGTNELIYPNPSEASTAANRPQLEIDYTETSPPSEDVSISSLLEGSVNINGSVEIN